MKTRVRAWGAAFALALGGLSHAQCFSDAQAVSIVALFQARKPIPNLPRLEAADAHCSRAKVQAELGRKLGPVIGYKVGLTHPAVRRMFKTDDPVWGTLYQGMLLPSGSVVPAGFGARPTVEADLMVRVGSDAINTAQTPEDVLKAIDQLIPFIELPDMMVEAPLTLDAHALMAINVAARLGVTGTPVPIPSEPAQRDAFARALGTMRLTMTDGEGRLLGHGQGADLLGHPLNAALWLVQALRREGIRLQAGQFLSLGTFSPILPTRPGMRFHVAFSGMPGAQPVWVQFAE
jgi:2-keto-4-pentenoate hydratase